MIKEPWFCNKTSFFTWKILLLYSTHYTLDVLWRRLPNLIQPMYYSGNHGLSSEYLSFIFRPAIISCVQFEIMMTYSIFATKEDIQQKVRDFPKNTLAGLCTAIVIIIHVIIMHIFFFMAWHYPALTDTRRC